MPPKVETLRWIGDEHGHLVLIDQTRLPTELVEMECHDVEAVWEAIKQLRVRGAPAIGIAAAYGVVVGMQQRVGCMSEAKCTNKSAEKGAFHARYGFRAALDEVTSYLAQSRP